MRRVVDTSSYEFRKAQMIIPDEHHSASCAGREVADGVSDLLYKRPATSIEMPHVPVVQHHNNFPDK